MRTFNNTILLLLLLLYYNFTIIMYAFDDGVERVERLEEVLRAHLAVVLLLVLFRNLMINQ